ncbi:hypothetical protein [Pontibacter ruber]|uniref:Lipoprotein n=1 Tax=Pontibacter ruber TaxID=1343895 RepID=A0ABW5D211_9BACT|nr:hypothetical protein [Pontibacter ruber]
MRIKLLASFFFVCTFLSCDSDKDTAPAPEPVKTFDFSFRYDTSLEGAKDYELILSDKEGKVLLDTLIAFNANHNLRIKSADTKHNLTTILIDPTNNRYWMETFVQVNPHKWHLQYRYDGSRNPVEFEKAEITYTNIPFDRDFHFSSRLNGGYAGSLSSNTLELSFNRLLLRDQAYIMLPSHGKYLFTEITSSQTTVDFTKAGNTEKLKYSKPANITNFSTVLDGFTKAGDYTSRISLYSSSRIPYQEYDLQYPPSPNGFEDFNVTASYTDAGGYYHQYQQVGKSVPTEIDFAPTSDFSVTKQGFEDFAITFTDDKPSMYKTYWSVYETGLDLSWNIYSSPDKSSYQPKSFLEGLKSKKLTGVDFSALELKTVTSSKFEGYTYQEYLDLKANPGLYIYNAVKKSRWINKAF